MRGIKTPKPDWTLDWLRARVRSQHHAILTKYLMHRGEERKAEAESIGFTVNYVLKNGFNVKNGQTAVPRDAMRVMRKVPEASARLVYELIQKSEDVRQLPDFIEQLRRHRPEESELLQEAERLLVVRAVHLS